MPPRGARTTATANSATPTVLVPGAQVLDAWNWVKIHLTPRPAHQSGKSFVYDCKRWAHSSPAGPLELNPVVVSHLANLYFVSQIGDAAKTLILVNDDIGFDVCLRGPLDADVKGVVDKQVRFRAALAEHLAYWTRLGTAKLSGEAGRFSCSKPNIQPEDKGPDGIFVQCGNVLCVEIQSVKNSLNDPRALVASGGFRAKGKPKKGKALDDFFRLSRKNVGFVRYDQLLSQASLQLGFSADEDIRYGLIATCRYNAVVVADHSHAREDVFEGYHHVTADVARHIGTYVGSTSWKSVAEATRKKVKQILSAAGR